MPSPTRAHTVKCSHQVWDQGHVLFPFPRDPTRAIRNFTAPLATITRAAAFNVICRVQGVA
ncbi:hypothetical protein BC826DRAFT_1069419 [Russula brevipes]|nr:hypothetical protein BC826DRAFT_1069419 [Russula brevipes]